MGLAERAPRRPRKVTLQLSSQIATVVASLQTQHNPCGRTYDSHIYLSNTHTHAVQDGRLAPVARVPRGKPAGGGAEGRRVERHARRQREQVRGSVSVATLQRTPHPQPPRRVRVHFKSV
jgi:hypothetical protein